MSKYRIIKVIDDPVWGTYFYVRQRCFLILWPNWELPVEPHSRIRYKSEEEAVAAIQLAIRRKEPRIEEKVREV